MNIIEIKDWVEMGTDGAIIALIIKAFLTIDTLIKELSSRDNQLVKIIHWLIDIKYPGNSISEQSKIQARR